MKKYVCRVCGYIEETDSLLDSYVCPMCGVDKSNFDELNDIFSDLEIDAVIDSIIEETFEEKTNKIMKKTTRELELVKVITVLIG